MISREWASLRPCCEQSDVTMVRDLQRTLWQRMTKPQRVRWLLVRAFTPLKKRQYTRFLRGDAA